MNKKKDDEYTPLHVASQDCHTDCVKVLLAHKDITVNAQDEDGYTPFHYCAKNGKIECLRLHLQEDIDINSVNQNNATPLQLARANNHIECFRLLVSRHNANVNMQGDQGSTPLHIGCRMEILFMFNY